MTLYNDELKMRIEKIKHECFTVQILKDIDAKCAKPTLHNEINEAITRHTAALIDAAAYVSAPRVNPFDQNRLPVTPVTISNPNEIITNDVVKNVTNNEEKCNESETSKDAVKGCESNESNENSERSQSNQDNQSNQISNANKKGKK